MMTMSVPVALPMIDKVPVPKPATHSVRRAPAALVSRISSLVGHLIKLPVADPQCGSDVLRLGAVQDQALHGTVERRPGNVGFVLGMDQPLLGLPGLGQPLLIHLAHSSEVLRQTPVTAASQPAETPRSVGQQALRRAYAKGLA
jgi:hypothetical protein